MFVNRVNGKYQIIFIESNIFRCSVCQKANLLSMEPPQVRCCHCGELLQVPEIIKCPKCNSENSELVGKVSADSYNTKGVDAGGKIASAVLFGPIGLVVSQ